MIRTVPDPPRHSWWVNDELLLVQRAEQPTVEIYLAVVRTDGVTTEVIRLAGDLGIHWGIAVAPK